MDEVPIRRLILLVYISQRGHAGQADYATNQRMTAQRDKRNGLTLRQVC